LPEPYESQPPRLEQASGESTPCNEKLGLAMVVGPFQDRWRRSLRLLVPLASFIGLWMPVGARAIARTDSATGSGESKPITVAAAIAGTTAVSSRAVPARPEDRVAGDGVRQSRSIQPRRFASATGARGSDAWYWEMGITALVLAACGGLVAVAKRLSPQGGAGGLRVVSRVSLSPKHSVYVVRAGGRTLLIGAGPQGAPALISELDDFPEIPQPAVQGDAP
jgi:flagellar protein FliO/FliZ